ncbi:hypothetical protein [Hyphomicrobium sp. DY-1]|uniref:hypothetical protein n=1 Tax=Hyphomicrobium sp. DY-1 TaxID=3075650 RepID=UPI0039C43DC2
MRVLGFLIMSAALSGNVMALEASAGADNVNSSQLGINAKIDASNQILTAGMNQMLACNIQGKLFDSTADVCKDPGEPLAAKIAACTTNKEFYNQATGECMTSAPDLTNQLNNTNALLTAMANCYNARGTFNVATGVCSASSRSASIKQVYVSPVYNNTKSKKDKTYSLGTADLCVISLVKGSTSQPRGGCTMAGVPGGTWNITISSYSDSARWCQATCYDFQ